MGAFIWARTYKSHVSAARLIVVSRQRKLAPSPYWDFLCTPRSNRSTPKPPGSRRPFANAVLTIARPPSPTQWEDGDGDSNSRTTGLFIFVSFPQRFLDDVIHVCEDYEMLLIPKVVRKPRPTGRN